ncbi:hypothetical protein [uncultured Paraglaciecola sp.]|uniref:hypothetical protein n=1 Tax=uncultured Paraglaciecola sp. TaxID=1765024 RepID=UPI00261CEFDC|nr:hypothetical protein [uncultured Paraglaciecola sp.]
MKMCSRCHNLKEDIEYSIRKFRSGNYGLRGICKECSCLRDKEYRSKFTEDRKTKIRSQVKKISKEWRERNRDKDLARKVEYRIRQKTLRLQGIKHDHHVILHERILESRKNAKHDCHVKEWKKDKARFARWKHKNDPNYIVYQRLKTCMNKHIKRKTDSIKWSKYLKCTTQELIDHLEKQFLNGMDWGNKGLWHIDHIIPVSSFDLTREEDIIACYRLSNLRPLWSGDNISKSNKIENLL